MVLTHCHILPALSTFFLVASIPYREVSSTFQNRKPCCAGADCTIEVMSSGHRWIPHNGPGTGGFSHGSPVVWVIHWLRFQGMGLAAPLTLWLCQNSYGKWPFIVDLPIKNGGSFHSYVTVYQRVMGKGCIRDIVGIVTDDPWLCLTTFGDKYGDAVSAVYMTTRVWESQKRSSRHWRTKRLFQFRNSSCSMISQFFSRRKPNV